jgi:leucyl aminopeptidase
MSRVSAAAGVAPSDSSGIGPDMPNFDPNNITPEQMQQAQDMFKNMSPQQQEDMIKQMSQMDIGKMGMDKMGGSNEGSNSNPSIDEVD